MTDAEQRILTSLVLMCNQYLLEPDGALYHMHMSAGEDAIATLADYGLVKLSGGFARWTPAGQNLLDQGYGAAPTVKLTIWRRLRTACRLFYVTLAHRA